LESGGGPTILSAPESNKKGLQACRESNFEMAIQEFKTAVRLNPTNAEYVNNLGYAYEMVGKYASSNYFCKKALDLAPSQTAAFGNLAFNFAKLDQPKQAGDYWDNYIANLHIGPKRQRGLDYLKDRMAKESDPRLTDSIRKALERAGAI
jgi:tetratricopeptide (TPR) repeat protein